MIRLVVRSTRRGASRNHPCSVTRTTYQMEASAPRGYARAFIQVRSVTIYGQIRRKGETLSTARAIARVWVGSTRQHAVAVTRTRGRGR